ncbi:hypothetical protein BDF22DRAFT_316540 [Syncephalis plumigaleata]|nr:hypothetical protein BDF22DRAFT_316540 [Syncephalis plumigaleata]
MASEAKEHVPIEFSSYDCAAIASGASLGSILFTGISCALFYWCYLRPSLICIRNQRRYGNDGIGGGSIENMALSSSSASPSVSNTTGSKWWHYLLFKQSSNNQLRLHNDCNNSKGGHRSSRGTTQDSDDSENDADITSSSTDERHGSKSNRHYGSSHGSTSSKGGRRARSGRSRYRQSTPTNDGNLDEIRGARRWWKKHLGRDRSKTVASSNHSSSIKSDQSVLGDSMEHSNLRRNVTKSHQASGSLGSISTAPSRIGGDVDYEYYYGEESDSGDGRKHSFHVDRRAVMRGIEAGYSPYSGIGATGSVFPSTIPSRNSDGRQQQQQHHHLHQHGRSPSQRSSLNDVFPPLSNGLGHPSMMNQEWYDLRPAGPGIGSIASDLHDSLDYTPRLRIANPSRCYSGNLTGDSASEISSYTFMTNITNNNSNNSNHINSNSNSNNNNRSIS